MSSLSEKEVAQDIVLTDPPYYDAIPYSDLMDFFFVWQKRILGNLNSEFINIYSRTASPKWDSTAQDGELIQDESRHNGDKLRARKAYEDGMAQSFSRCFETLNESGRFVVVFANKEVAAWETLVAAMIRSGFVVTASWPIQTEMPSGLRIFNRASLSSSVWIVCRKRPTHTQAGWDANVLARMKQILF
jgi:adenine-specific DNA methylase